METQPARETVGSEEVLRCGRGVHSAGDGDELSWFQSDEGAGVFRNRAGVLDAASFVIDQVDDQQPEDHGQSCEYVLVECAWVDHDGGDLRCEYWFDCDVVYIGLTIDVNYVHEILNRTKDKENRNAQADH